MSNPLQNSLSVVEVPAPLETSGLIKPFLVLAKISHERLAESVSNSAIGRFFVGIYGCLKPIHEKLAPYTRLHEFLAGLHFLSVALLLVLMTYASTGMIAKAVVVSFVLLLIRAITTPLTWKYTMVDVLVKVFFLTAFMATAFSSYVHSSVIGLAKFLVFYFAFLNFRLLIGNSPKGLYRILTVLICLGFLESMIGFYQYIHHVQPLATWQDPSVNPEDQLTRIFGTLTPSNPNLLAGFLVPCLAAGFGMAFTALFEKAWLKAVGFACLAGPILLALVLTGSRGGYLSLLCMSVFTFLYLGHLLWHEPDLKTKSHLKGLWILVLIGACLATLGGILVLPAIRNRFLSIFAMREDSSNSYRLNVWGSTFRMIRDNWLLGIGPGNNTFKEVYGLYMVPGYNALSAYSIFLEIWAEQGILGLLAFFLLIIVSFARFVLVFYSAWPIQQKVTVAFLLTGILGSVTYGLFDTIWYRPSVNLLFWLFVAAFSVYTERFIVKNRHES